MQHKPRIYVVLSVTTILLLSAFPWQGWLANFAGESDAPSNTAADSTEQLDDYGYDRLEAEQTATEQWLPPTETTVSEASDNAYSLDTLSYESWQTAINEVTYHNAESHLLPLSTDQKVRIWRPANVLFSVLLEAWPDYALFEEKIWNAHLPTIADVGCAIQMPQIILLNESVWKSLSIHSFSTSLLQLATLHPILLIYEGKQLPTSLSDLRLPVIQLKNSSPEAEHLMVETIYGAQELHLAEGGFLAATRLGHAPPEWAGIDREKLARMDRYIQSAIRRKAIPGCQVLVAKGGKIVMEKSYGFHTYAKEQAVSNNDLYDLASITKAAATSLSIMKLVSEGELVVTDRLREVLPAFEKSNVRYLRIKHLLSHHTGLQANLPIARWLNDAESFARTPGVNYPNAIDQDFYLRAGIRSAIRSDMHKLRIPKRLYYRYSDVNFLLLQEVIETNTNQRLDQYVSSQFYDRLGLKRLKFRPGLEIPATEIVPTELDRRWRQGLVHGEVHDESAALLGGVAGHAGLFGNARDVAAVFQLLINEGSYGGIRYLEPETVKQFTKRNGYNARAMGFDRLASHSKSLRYYGASLATFGHTGFTGTCVWADPDNDLIFVFLSNRIHPNKYNNKLQKLGLRERIHKIIYQSLGTAVAQPYI